MSKEAIGENGAILGSSDYWERVNRDTIFGRLMHRSSETNYHQTLQETGRRASAAIAEVYDDLQEHIGAVRAIPSENRRALAKQVEELYDVCRMSGVSCSRSSDCVGILNLSAFYLPRAASLDDHAVQEAVRKIRNHPDFFASECVELIQKAVDWSISFAAGSDKRKRAFLEDVSQGKNKEFLQDVLDAYHASKGSADLRGDCGRSIGSRDYRDHLEKKVFLQELSVIQRDDYDGTLKDALSSIAHRLLRDLERNERDNNYITDETARLLRDVVKDLEQCGIHPGIPDSAISRVAWFVGGDPAKIRRLQSKLNALGIGQHLEEDGVYGEKTLHAWLGLLNRLENGSVPTLKWIDPLQTVSNPFENNERISLAIKSSKAGKNNAITNAETGFHYFRIDDAHILSTGIPKKGYFRGKQVDLDYPHININFGDSSSRLHSWIKKNFNHYPLDNKTYEAIKDLDSFGKTVRIAGKVFLVAGTALDALELGLSIQNDLTDADKKLGKTTLSSAVSIGGRWAGSVTGAKLGALVGGLTGPAAPVAIPVLSLVGGIAGSFGGDALCRWVVDITVTED